MVVEDDFDAREAIAELLSDHGHQVRVAANGQEALDLLHREIVDLIVLDLWLPVMDGWKFRAVQRADSALSHLPVIAISADRSPQAEAIHADCYVRKPLDAAQFLLAIERVLLETERQQLTDRLRQTEHLTVLGTLAASIGHEVNNPLTYVIGNVYLLEQIVVAARRRPHSLTDSDMFDRMAELLGEVRTGADRIHGVMTTLQPLSRGREDPPSPVNVRLVVESSIAIVGNQIRHRARLIRSLQEVPNVMGNEARLGQVFVNLLVNAAQAIPAGASADNLIRVATRTSAGKIFVEIQDSGAGIPAEIQARIFEPFFTTKPRSEGTGIGLTLSRTIVEEHGGHIEFDSAPGRGSIFTVILPVFGAAVAGSDRPQNAAAPALSPPGRILVIDDDRLVLQTVKRMLEPHHQITTTSGARDALMHVRAGQKYDAILCDVMMPEMTGIQFYAELKREHPRLAARVIFMTGGGLLPEVGAFRDTMEGRWIDKPFNGQSLQLAVAEIIGSMREEPN